MIYKTSFNSLEVSVTGVYSVYNVTQDELAELERIFSGKLNGSKGNYTVYKGVERNVLLNLFVHGYWNLISFDIRKDLLKLFNSKKIYVDKIKKLSKKLKEQRVIIQVNYNPLNDTWSIVDYDKFLSLLEELIKEL